MLNLIYIRSSCFREAVVCLVVVSNNFARHVYGGRGSVHVKNARRSGDSENLSRNRRRLLDKIFTKDGYRYLSGGMRAARKVSDTMYGWVCVSE